jgi:membrane associated rhomboid family serine protease
VNAEETAMKKFEFSKLALGSAVFAYFTVVALSAWVAIKCVIAQDFSSAAIVVGATTGIVGSVTGVAYAFYSHKAKAENIVKIAQSMNPEEVSETAQLAQTLGGLQ